MLAEEAKSGMLTTRRISGARTTRKRSGGMRPLHATADDGTATVERAEDTSMPDDGCAFLGAVGDALRQLDLAFDIRGYMCK